MASTSSPPPQHAERTLSTGTVGDGAPPARSPSLMSSTHRMPTATSFFSSSGMPGGAPPPVRRSSTEVMQSKLPAFMRDIAPVSGAPAADGDIEKAAGTNEGTAVGNSEHDEKMAAHHEEHVRRTLSKRLEAKNMIIVFVAEFIGTFLFLFFALAINTTCANASDALIASGENGVNLTALLVSSFGFGMSLTVSAWVFFRVSGGVQNPAITLALTITGALTWTKCAVLTLAQFLGGLAAAGLVAGLYPSSLNTRTVLSPEVGINAGFWLEFFMSCMLIFTVLMLAAEKHKATFLSPLPIGLALFVTQLLGQPYTGASVNPARTLGPDVAQHMFDGYCWIYYLAPYFAAVVTSGFYLLLKWVRYETATPDQDADEHGAGQVRQLLMDTQGNIVGTMDQVAADEYDPEKEKQRREEEHAEMQEAVRREAAAALPHADSSEQLAVADRATDGLASGDKGMANPSVGIVDKGPAAEGGAPTDPAVIEANKPTS